MATLKRAEWHPSITDEVVQAAVERRRTVLEDPGFCIVCGTEHNGIEPDAQHYRCEACGTDQVFGAEELLMELQ